tara:strand:- start:2096 stop:2446 length:351 start_codon:yes stop_codon:yes gene_type:complete
MTATNKLICEDWCLYEPICIGFKSQDPATGQFFMDQKETMKQLRVFGTKAQLEQEKKKDKYLIDEVFNYKVEPKGSYWYIFYSDPKATNKEVAQKLRVYEKLYELNDRKVLIINIQ